jgi:hypothetical protein
MEYVRRLRLSLNTELRAKKNEILTLAIPVLIYSFGETYYHPWTASPMGRS